MTPRRLDPALPDGLSELVRALAGAGGRPFLVGGTVRDRLLGLPATDFDLEVHGLAAPRLAELLRAAARVESVGESFAVYKVAGLAGVTGAVDVALPRRDSKAGRGHRGFVVEGDPDLGVDEAVRRRDFTVNAILADAVTGEVVDPAGGIADLEARTLRVVDPGRFGDDSLRVLRGAQLAARFGFSVEPATAALCASIPLDDLPAERVSDEMEKLLLRAPVPSVGLRLLRDWGKLAEVVPELLPCIDCPQEPAWHPEGDVFVHTLLAVDRVPSVIAGERWGDLPPAKRWTVALAVLAHDFGKPATTVFRDGRWRSPGHEEAGIAPTTALLDRWNVHRRDGYDVRGQVIALVANHLKPGQFFDDRDRVSDGAFRRLARRCEPDLLARVAAADSLGRTGEQTDEPMRWFRARAEELAVAERPPDPILLGRHLLPLGVPPGPALGRLLAEVYERQLDGAVTDLDGALAVARRILDRPDGG